MRRDGDIEAVPLVCVGLSVMCFQFGAALATPLFATIGAQGASALRLGLAACVLNLVLRPWRGLTLHRAGLWTIGYGLGLAGLNLFFYFAIRTVPLGITVAIEVLGPLGLAAAASRRPGDLGWAVLAMLGMACLLPLDGLDQPLDPHGVGFALLSATSWVVYIVCGRRAGQASPGHGIVAAGLTVAALAVLPFGIAHAGRDLVRSDVLPLAAAVALVSGCVPYGLEMVAMRRLPTRVFGVLMSLEPVAGALFGFLMLGQHLSGLQSAAIVLVVLASAGSSLTGPKQPAPPPESP